ncbi:MULTISPECIES: indole-3-glycerol phosphate synthase TrpC [Streptomyces]|uniref:indole-3-glycerol phosphate synthase TrpC n=1 Tax=Streptomyces TaxID=1883 RepID=UPI000ECA166F|nr:indole-3-glycerol phosphate synthase TrpC [Streptomyces sp. DHE17-7]MBJ6622132.1 indole-3-glycerol phosphate synthase TrpC [Streptomyces sp. DHE17-7]RIH60619.1 indole-3-glycerol phosphate synthase TrpC [Streptomyces sp. SHP22-7]
MSGILDTLVADAELQTRRRRAARPEAELADLAAAAPPARDFAAALRGPGLGVIAEMKPRSPSKGPLTDDYRPAELARAYQEGGAHALSVLTHEAGFGGSPEHLAVARAACDLPVLRKDFITDEYQILEARALGADALLLIVAALSPERLAELLAHTRAQGMAALVEVHDEREVDVALAAGADIIGVNHRDLRDFSIDRTLSARLRGRVGTGRVMVGESGVRGAADARALEGAGVDAVLVGELLMRAGDPGATIKELVG